MPSPARFFAIGPRELKARALANFATLSFLQKVQITTVAGVGVAGLATPLATLALGGVPGAFSAWLAIGTPAAFFRVRKTLLANPDREASPVPPARVIAVGPLPLHQRMLANLVDMTPEARINDITALATIALGASQGAAFLATGHIGVFGAYLLAIAPLQALRLSRNLLKRPEAPFVLFTSPFGQMLEAAAGNDVASLETLHEKIGGPQKLRRAMVKAAFSGDAPRGEWSTPAGESPTTSWFDDTPLSAALRAKSWTAAEWLLEQGYIRHREGPNLSTDDPPFADRKHSDHIGAIPAYLDAPNALFAQHLNRVLDAALAYTGENVKSHLSHLNAQLITERFRSEALDALATALAYRAALPLDRDDRYFLVDLANAISAKTVCWGGLEETPLDSHLQALRAGRGKAWNIGMRANVLNLDRDTINRGADALIELRTIVPLQRTLEEGIPEAGPASTPVKNHRL
jgi:hypothetical protein